MVARAGRVPSHPPAAPPPAARASTGGGLGTGTCQQGVIPPLPPAATDFKDGDLSNAAAPEQGGENPRQGGSRDCRRE